MRLYGKHNKNRHLDGERLPPRRESDKPRHSQRHVLGKLLTLDIIVYCIRKDKTSALPAPNSLGSSPPCLPKLVHDIGLFCLRLAQVLCSVCLLPACLET